MTWYACQLEQVRQICLHYFGGQDCTQLRAILCNFDCVHFDSKDVELQSHHSFLRASRF